MVTIKKKWLQWAVVSISFVILCSALANNIYFNWRYRLIMFFVALALFMIILLITKRFALRMVGAFVMVALACFLFYTQAVLGAIMSPTTSDTIVYQLYTLRSSEEGDRVYGELGQPETRDEYIVEAYLENKIEDPDIHYFDNVSDLVLALYEYEVDAIWIDTRFMNEVIAFFPDFSTRTIGAGSYVKTIEREDTTKDVDILSEPYIVYVSGIDVYGSIHTRSRSDLNLLLVVNPNTHEILSISIPRDTYIGLSCQNNAMDKLTHAALYGVDCSIGSLEALLDININYYLRVNFTSLQTVVDALGVVDVYSNYDFETDSGFVFEKGLNSVDGTQAIAFARERLNIPYGDISRGVNHQALLEAIFRKMISAEMISWLPTYLPNLLNVIDTDFGYDNFAQLIANQIDNSAEWAFTTMNLTGKGDMQYTFSQGDTFKYYVYWPDGQSVQSIQDAITTMLQGEASDE